MLPDVVSVHVWALLAGRQVALVALGGAWGAALGAALVALGGDSSTAWPPCGAADFGVPSSREKSEN